MSSTETQTVTANSVNLMATDPPKEIFRSDYKPPVYYIQHIYLDFELDYEDTVVKSVLHIHRNENSPAFTDLILHGEDTLSLKSVQLELQNDTSPKVITEKNYKLFSNGVLSIDGHLLPDNPKEIFKLHIIVHVNPSTNTELMGLYKAGPILCTQCEAEGFRRITYSIDRPDVMATYKVRLEAVKSTFPVLLSNGNQTGSGDLSDDRHFVIYEDPFVKPSYLFAIVAGDLALKEDKFIAGPEKKNIRLSLWCEPRDANKLDWAMESLKKAMKWDEDRFGRVYDLDWFNVVAVSYFNMGAMENKSLNIFNTSLLLASKKITVDENFLRIMAVIGHEYFHNWTGNRITCRDWFQLTLKEGLTVYRDQEFSSDLGSRLVERIKNVSIVRSYQFSEDNGPMAHSIRPESYQQIDNFYTTTVYRKGAEVVRMYETILGRDGFRKGMDLYFQRHDGKAVTCDDFRAAMADANGVDLTQFERWYSQAGTPTVTLLSSKYNAAAQSYTLTLKQECGLSPKQPTKKPFDIPVSVGLIGRHSKKEIVPTRIFRLTQEQQTFEIKNVSEDPVISLFRNWSAPIKFVSSLPDADYGFLMAYDTDGFNRWEATQTLFSKIILERAHLYCNGGDLENAEIPGLNHIVEGFRQMLKDANKPNADLYFISFSLIPPAVSALMNDMRPCEPTAIHKARKDVRNVVARELANEFLTLYNFLSKTVQSRPWDLTAESIGIRALRNSAMSYLTHASNLDLAFKHYLTSDNMNDRLAAFTVLANFPSDNTTTVIDDFLKQAEGDDLVIDAWFSAQAGADHEHVLNDVKRLKNHALFNMTNPNRMRSLITRFTLNLGHFHHISGDGYKFVGECITELDKINGRMSAGVARQIVSWQTLDSRRQELMKAELYKLAAHDLSGHCKEVVTKGLTP